MSSDPRIPVVFGGQAQPGDMVLIEGAGNSAPDRVFFTPGPLNHKPGCTCCPPRSPAVSALARLFVARARGDVPPFTRLRVIGTDAAAAVQAAVKTDLLASARYRLANPSPPRPPTPSA